MPTEPSEPLISDQSNQNKFSRRHTVKIKESNNDLLHDNTDKIEDVRQRTNTDYQTRYDGNFKYEKNPKDVADQVHVSPRYERI